MDGSQNRCGYSGAAQKSPCPNFKPCYPTQDCRWRSSAEVHLGNSSQNSLREIASLLMLSLILWLTAARASARQAVGTLPVPTTSPDYVSSVKVWLPPDYADFPNRRYVTVYLIDAQADALFEYVRATVQYLISEGQLDPVILIGVSTSQRQYDFTPAPQTESGKSDFAKSGGAEDYFRYVSRQVVPAVETKYRCEP